MNIQLLTTFVILTIVNVIIQTVKSIATIKCGKASAAVINAVAYGLYTIVIVYTNCELDLWLKAGITAAANLIGVYIVKDVEERRRKDKLWKVEATLTNAAKVDATITALDSVGISYNYFETSRGHIVFNCFCHNQRESELVRGILEQSKAKWFVSETKSL